MKTRNTNLKFLIMYLASTAISGANLAVAAPTDELQVKLGSTELPLVEFRNARITDVVGYLNQQSKVYFQHAPVAFALETSSNTSDSVSEYGGPTRVSLRQETGTFLQLIAEIQECSNTTATFSTDRVTFISRNPHDAVSTHGSKIPARVFSSESAPIPDKVGDIARIAVNAMHTAPSNGRPFGDVINGKYPIQISFRFRQTAYKYMSSPVDGSAPVEMTVKGIKVDDSAPLTILVDRLVAGGSVESAIPAESWLFDPHLGSASESKLRGFIWAYHTGLWPNVLSPGIYRITVTLNTKVTHSDTSVSDVRFSESAQLKIMPGPSVEEAEKCFMAWIWHAYHLATQANEEALAKRAIQVFEELVSLEENFALSVDHEGTIGDLAYRLNLYDIAHSALGKFIAGYTNEHELISGGDSHKHDAYYRATRIFNELCVQRGVENP